MIDGDWQVAVEREELSTTHISHEAAMMFAADSVLYTITQAPSTDLVERNGREDVSIERCNAQIICCPSLVIWVQLRPCRSGDLGVVELDISNAVENDL